MRQRKSKSRRLKYYFASFFSLFALGSFVTIFVVIGFAEKKLSKLVLGGLGESFSTKIYAAPTIFKNAHSYSWPHFIERLKQCNYSPSPGIPIKPGQYHFDGKTGSLFVRQFNIPSYAQPAEIVSIKMESNGSWAIEDSLGITLPEFGLEPVLIAELSGKKRIRRSLAEWDDFPPHLIHAVISAEDHRYFRHWGVRPLAIFRALLHNIRREGPPHGGSTITQQLAKNLFLTPQRTLRRKMVEALLAVYLEFRYSKEKILSLYLNHIYLGQDGFVSVAGVHSAAKFYFGKDLKELTIEDSATLAGLIRSPYLYNPFRDPDKCKNRRDHILRRMMEEKFISSSEWYEAQQTPLSVSKQALGASTNESVAFFISEVIRQLIPLYGEEALYRFGLKIYTTMDLLYQDWAHAAVQKTSHQAALVVLNPSNGATLALVGGKDYQKSQFNRVTQARRQPGSAFKPFVYGAALEKGYTPTSVLNDTFQSFKGKVGENLWSPRNFDDIYRGTVTLRQGLSHSINAATLDLARKVTPVDIIDFARRMGIISPLEPTLALALGAYEVTLIEITGAYAPFINGGFRIKPYLVSSVLDAKGTLIEMDSQEKKSVLDPALSYLISSLLQSVIEEGTAKRLKKLGWKYPSAGKTGTTNKGKDAWFIGYTSDLLVGTWVGNDQAKPIYASGSKNAVPIWAQFMKKRTEGNPPPSFQEPQGILKIKIDPQSNQLAQSGCPQTKFEWYLKGSEPTEKCHMHPGGIKGWFRKLFS
ncbi:hypothetical protein BVX98_06415 [bacterium F11]|nr:hypothetical protein BVX98_06415 [bacterium F11]